MQLPEDFIQETRLVMGEERFNRFMEAFNEDAPTSIRLNPRASQGDRHGVRFADRTPCLSPCEVQQVPWCPEGYYLSGRPQFTFDPFFHAGCYYVQEAASMFITHVLRTILSPLTSHPSPLTMLDLCAAPGGKSTAARTILPEGSVLVSNEPVATRAQILLENITKWGWSDCIVTNNYPRDFRKAKAKFDVILCDVPCSGEGMFRKDPNTISEWSLQNVERCWRLQREIVADAWECLTPGGILIYSTCTLNTKENEENVRWIMENYDAEILYVPTESSWNITGSLLEGFDDPVYRFIPGITRGEGLFMAVLRKSGDSSFVRQMNRPPVTRLKCIESPLLSGEEVGGFDLSYQEALKYLRGEALVLPTNTPKGLVTVTYKGFPLGPVKNIGNRANNLYPKPWRIKTTHLPTEEIKIIDIQ
jgi:16S rRNA C967 or C1407 C5-methylase (RsmB/RsmF family)